MRLHPLLAICLLLLGCSLHPAPAVAEEGGGEPVGNLAQLMRAIQFPNSNILFDVQSTDPDSPPEATEGGSSASALFSGMYKGWQKVEQAAIALAEVERLVMVPGRLCENGKPVPLEQEDFKKWAAALTTVGKATLEAAEAKDREKVSDLTNQLAGACEDCHIKYRAYQDRCRQ